MFLYGSMAIALCAGAIGTPLCSIELGIWPHAGWGVSVPSGRYIIIIFGRAEAIISLTHQGTHINLLLLKIGISGSLSIICCIESFAFKFSAAAAITFGWELEPGRKG